MNRYTKILVIDNYDSFVYSLVRYLKELGCYVDVYRNDALTINDIQKIDPHRILISPGPKSPEHAGISLSVIHEFYREIPILGVCLGHQCIGVAFGAKCLRMKRPVHGKTSWISHTETHLFKGLPNPLRVTRYHSLALYDLPECLEVMAKCDEVMAISHKTAPLYGVQFHPEALLSEYGHALLENFVTQ